MQKELPVRKNIRLKDYDYSQPGYYFITICVKNRHEMLGSIAVGAAYCRPNIILSNYGEIVKKWIDKIPDKYPYAKIENSVIMPNHIHMILSIQSDGRQNAAPTATMGSIMGYYKYQTTKEINIPGFWQSRFHDEIIRNEEAYQNIWRYIDNNPAKWAEDDYFVKK